MARKKTAADISGKSAGLFQWVFALGMVLLAVVLFLFYLLTLVFPFLKPKPVGGWLEDFEERSDDPYGLIKRGPLPELDTTPDTPVSFGNELNWLAIRAGSHNEAIESLPIDEVKSANWRTGLKAVFRGYTFVTPALNGWVLVVSQNLPIPGDNAWDIFMRSLARCYDEVQFFAIHSEHDHGCVWSRFRNGVEQRTLAFTLEGGEVTCDRGNSTEEETRLGLTSLSYDNRPDQEAVLQLAGVWSLNPDLLEELFTTEGVGSVGLIRRPNPPTLPRYA